MQMAIYFLTSFTFPCLVLWHPTPTFAWQSTA